MLFVRAILLVEENEKKKSRDTLAITALPLVDKNKPAGPHFVSPSGWRVAVSPRPGCVVHRRHTSAATSAMSSCTVPHASPSFRRPGTN